VRHEGLVGLALLVAAPNDQAYTHGNQSERPQVAHVDPRDQIVEQGKGTNRDQDRSEDRCRGHGRGST